MGSGFLQFWRILALVREARRCWLEAVSVARRCGSASGVRGSGILSLLQGCSEWPSTFCRGGLFRRSCLRASATRWSPHTPR